jgi:fluoride exporter
VRQISNTHSSAATAYPYRVANTGADTVTRQRARPPHTRSGPGAADLAAIAVGGGIGSLARYLLSAAFPAGHGFPWAIFVVNVSGSFVLGLLVVYMLDVWPPRRFLRPFLAVGLIGGYTTFSTYAGGVMTLLTGGRLALADSYALTSVLAALVAVWCGMKSARAAAALPARLRARGDDE